MFVETVPSDADINHCLMQLLTHTMHHHGDHVEKYARMRLADFSSALAEWRNPDYATLLGQGLLPKAAAAIQNSSQLSPQQSQKLVNLLQQAATQNNTTAMLYLAYFYAKALFVKQSLTQAAAFARRASELGDWRGTRFLAEMLAAVPAASPELLSAEVEKTAQIWYQPHKHDISQAALQAACLRFMNASAVIKQAIRQKLLLAKQQGSPNAEQLLRVWVIEGIVPPASPAQQFCDLNIWLDVQFAKTQHAPTEAEDTADEGVTLFPKHSPVLVHGDTAKPIWQKLLLWIGTMIVLMILIRLAQ